MAVVGSLGISKVLIIYKHFSTPTYSLAHIQTKIRKTQHSNMNTQKYRIVTYTQDNKFKNTYGVPPYLYTNSK